MKTSVSLPAIFHAGLACLILSLFARPLVAISCRASRCPAGPRVNSSGAARCCRCSIAVPALAHSNAPAGGGHPQKVHSAHERSMMTGMYGSYPMTRESSGTAWQPDSTPHEGIHFMKQDWMLMLHGAAQTVYDDQAGPRGAQKTYSSNMLMLMGSRPAGLGKLGFRTMFSAEPLTIGKGGYPLLLQTGETANGRTPLIDRQHPHDLFMELAMTYSFPVSDTSTLFAYFGLPGEPALGPPAFIHRLSGEEIPLAPISHHWLDSTHVAFGVATLGLVHKNMKLETSVFTGREPDEHRYDFDAPKFDSYAFRFSYNPGANWAFQASFGHIRSREELEPQINTDRVTLSGIYNRRWNQNVWQTLLAWGRNIDRPKGTTDAVLLESTVVVRDRHTLFARAERADKDELFLEGEPLAGETFRVGEVSLGYIYDFLNVSHFRAGLGGMGSVALVPAILKPAYGDNPVSGSVFLRLRF